MTSMTCFHCSAVVTNGLALCELCQEKARLCLEFLPIYFRNLARWRPGRAGSRPVPGSRVLYDGEPTGDGTGDRISDRLDETAAMLRTWARALCNDRPYLERMLDRLNAARQAETIDEAKTVAWLSLAFDRWLITAATLPWCGDFVRDLSMHEQTLRGLTETLVPGWYAGTCTSKGCGRPTYVVPGLTWVTCGSCGTTTAARDHVEIVMTEARDWVARPKRIAEALVALVDTEESVVKLHDRVRQWESRGRLAAVRALDVEGDEVGPKRYRLGDVLDLLRREGQTRTRMASAKVS